MFSAIPPLLRLGAPIIHASVDHAGGPALIELMVDPEAISPTRTLSGIQAQARSA